MAKEREELPNKIAIDMTPMIDVVFQLITFFMLTLKTVVTEGDFDIKMPLGVSAGAAPDDPLLPSSARGSWISWAPAPAPTPTAPRSNSTATRA